jgi:hypothetical protein
MWAFRPPELNGCEVFYLLALRASDAVFFFGGVLQMTDTEIRDAITANCDGAKAYRLIQERAGVLYYVPSQDKPPLNLSPFEYGVVPPGSYGVAYVDAGGKEFLREHRINVVVESLFPVVHASAAAPLAMEAAEVGHSLEIEKLNADTLMVRGGAQAFNDNLAFYANFQRALGTHSAAALRIENERIELMAKSIRTLLGAQAELVEASRQQIEKNKTPPPPPNWENIVAAGAPALAAMYTATIAAITKTAPVKVSGTAEPLAPQSEKLKVIYEALGNFSSKERLEAMLKDERKLKEWMKLVQGLIKDEAADQEPTDAE